MNDVDSFAKDSLAFAKGMGWTKDWVKGGCYIHLEASEFIESLRGKKGKPIEELGDVLMTVLSVAENYQLNPTEAMRLCREKMDRMLAKKLEGK